MPRKKKSQEDVAIQNMAKLLEQYGAGDKVEKDAKNENISDLYKEAFDASEPSSPRWFYAQKLRQAMWKTMGRTKTHDFSLHGTPRLENGSITGPSTEVEIVMTEGIKTVLDRANDAETYAGKNGVMFNAYMYGNGYRMIGRRGQNTVPIEFLTIPNSNLYLSKRSTGLRRGSKPTQRACAVFSGTQDEFNALFPDHASEDCLGELPRHGFNFKDSDLSDNQGLDDEKIVEWGYYFQTDGESPMYRLVVGREMKVIESKDGPEYPYYFDNEEGVKEYYIPISDYICDPTAEGLFCEGLGSVLYRLAVAGRMTMNLAYGNVKENTFPHTLVEGIPTDQAQAFFEMVEMADELSNQGKRPYIPVPSNPLNPGSVRTNALMNQGDVNGALAFLQLIDQEIKRNGVNLDEFEGEDPTEMQIRAYDENASAFVRQVGEYNAQMRKFELLVVLDLLKKTIKKTNKTPLNLRTAIGLEEVKGATLGMMVEELKKNHYFIELNARSASIPSNLMRRTQLQQTLAMLPPGTPEYVAVAKQLASFDGVELPLSAQPMQAPMPPAEEQSLPLPPEPALV